MTITNVDELRRKLEQSLVPPPGVTELDPNSISTATSRLGNACGGLSESYHLNSGLSRADFARLSTQTQTKVVQEFYFNTASQGADAMLLEGSGRIVHIPDFASEVAPFLAACWLDPIVMSALFSVDVTFVFGNSLWKQVAARSYATFEGTWGEPEIDQLVNAIPGFSAAMAEGAHFIFISAAIARTSYLQGRRAYRTCAFNAGVVASAIAHSATHPQANFRPMLIENFIDASVNEVLRNDGVDRGLLAVLCLVPLRQSTTPSDENPPNVQN